MLIQSHTGTDWTVCCCAVSLVFHSLSAALHTSWLWGGVRHRYWTCTLGNSRQWKPAWGVRSSRPRWSGTEDRTGQDAEAKGPVGGTYSCWPQPGAGVLGGAIIALWQHGATAKEVSWTTSTQLRTRPGGGSSPTAPRAGTLAPDRPTRAWLTGQRGTAHLHLCLGAWCSLAAKVAFFTLNLVQLMESLCRVCLAESRQNLRKYSTSRSVWRPSPRYPVWYLWAERCHLWGCWLGALSSSCLSSSCPWAVVSRPAPACSQHLSYSGADVVASSVRLHPARQPCWFHFEFSSLLMLLEKEQSLTLVIFQLCGKWGWYHWILILASIQTGGGKLLYLVTPW